MKTVLVTGGAGYIGSHTLEELRASGCDPICFDNLSTGFRSFARGVRLVEGDLARAADLDRAFEAGTVAAVIHFASHALVGESYRDPYKYYHDNIGNTLELLEAMRRHQVGALVFSSSCSVYGVPARVPITEDMPLDPINPYGATKMVIERILRDYEAAHGFRSVSLRYFNAAGADPQARMGEWHRPEEHLIPRLFQVALGEAAAAAVYGDDYPTRDGTCIRDYIHVTDLARAHVAALEHLARGAPSDVFNLGTGAGHTVLEVLEQARATTGAAIPAHRNPRRPGDPPELVADATKAKTVLGCVPRHSSLEEIVETAWAWHRRRAHSEF
jgi:UDP-glucose-4-epimerase GalE